MKRVAYFYFVALEIFYFVCVLFLIPDGVHPNRNSVPEIVAIVGYVYFIDVALFVILLLFMNHDASQKRLNPIAGILLLVNTVYFVVLSVFALKTPGGGPHDVYAPWEIKPLLCGMLSIFAVVYYGAKLKSREIRFSLGIDNAEANNVIPSEPESIQEGENTPE